MGSVGERPISEAVGLAGGVKGSGSCWTGIRTNPAAEVTWVSARSSTATSRAVCQAVRAAMPRVARLATATPTGGV